MVHDALDVANHFLALSRNTKNQLQIQKLVYFAHGHMLGMYGVPLIRDPIEAWDWGPVVPNLWRKFRRFRALGTITTKPRPPKAPFSNKEYDALDRVWNRYGEYEGEDLARLTHDDQKHGPTPWELCDRNERIGDDSIKEYFGRVCAQLKAAR